MKIGLLLMKDVLENMAIPRYFNGSGFTALAISNEELYGIMNAVKLPEESSLAIKCVSEMIKKTHKHPKVRFRSTLLGTLASKLLENILRGK